MRTYSPLKFRVSSVSGSRDSRGTEYAPPSPGRVILRPFPGDVLRNGCRRKKRALWCVQAILYLWHLPSFFLSLALTVSQYQKITTSPNLLQVTAPLFQPKITSSNSHHRNCSTGSTAGSTNAPLIARLQYRRLPPSLIERASRLEAVAAAWKAPRQLSDDGAISETRPSEPEGGGRPRRGANSDKDKVEKVINIELQKLSGMTTLAFLWGGVRV